MSHLKSAALATVLAAMLATAAAGEATDCVAAAGDAASQCLRRYSLLIERCRRGGDPACEEAARADDGALAQLVAASTAPLAAVCSDSDAELLAFGFLNAADVALRVGDACRDFAEDFLPAAYGRSDGLTAREWTCQRRLVRDLTRLRAAVVRAWGRECHVAGYAGTRCDRTRRDRLIERLQQRSARDLARRCGAELVSLGLPDFTGEAEVAPALDALLARTVVRGRHLAQLTYPPNDLGPDADFGPYPVGIRTLELVDASRPAADGAGPRPVTVEVYYPSTAAGVAGVPRDIATVLDIPLIETPAYRDVPIAPGPFPLVLFSHGNNGIRIQSFYFGAHLASHGYVVASPDHHGNIFPDMLRGISDADVVANRPRDMVFVLDELVARSNTPGDDLAGAIDADRVGISGHSFGGYTSFLLAAGDTREPRIKAIFPQAPGAILPDEHFAGITVPTLIIGGSIDETTPFDSQQRRRFDALPTGAAVVGLAEVRNAGHFTFSDFCEVPRALLSFLGGFDEACEPRHLPWRHAHDIINLLALRFFDAVLRDDPAALAGLTPAALADIEDLTYTSK